MSNMIARTLLGLSLLATTMAAWPCAVVPRQVDNMPTVEMQVPTPESTHLPPGRRGASPSSPFNIPVPPPNLPG